MQLGADQNCEVVAETTLPKSTVGSKRAAGSSESNLKKISGPKRPRPYQLAARLELTSQQVNCNLSENDRISEHDLGVVRQTGLEGLLLSIVCGRRPAPSFLSRECVANYREQVGSDSAENGLRADLAVGFIKWIARFDLNPAEVKRAVATLDLHLSEQARARRAVLPRMPFDWNDAISAIAKDAWLPMKMRSAAYALRHNNPILLCAIKTDPFRASIALRKLLAPPQRNCSDELFDQWRTLYTSANVSELTARILPLAAAPLLKIAADEAAIGLRLITLEGSDERLKRRSGAELMILGQALPRELLGTLGAINCDYLISPASYEALERICKCELLPARASKFLGSSKKRFTLEEAEVELLTGQRWRSSFDSVYIYKPSQPDDLQGGFMDVARRLPLAVETCVLNRLEEVNPQASPNLYQLLLNALGIVRNERSN